MGVQDRDWYWEDRRRKERLHYNPKSFRGSKADAVAARSRRPGFATLLAILFVLALAFAPTVGRWWSERLLQRDAAPAVNPGEKEPRSRPSVPPPRSSPG